MNSSSATWPLLVDAAQAVALDAGADRAGQQGREQQRRPEAEPLAELEAEEGAEHVEAGMREIEHAQHAEDDGEAARHQEQQHSEQHAVERGYDDQFKHDAPPGPGDASAPESFRSGRGLHANGQFGRSILQVVGSTVAGVSIFATSFQPQPVFSSSNGSLCGAFAERRDVDRLEELVVVLAHEALAAVEHLELHAFERERDLDRIDRLGLLGGRRQHPHFVDGARIEQADVVLGAESPFRTPATAGLTTLGCLR